MMQAFWNVESLEDFLYYICPECDNRNPSRDEFLHHALSKHQGSNDYLMKFSVKEEFNIDNYDDIEENCVKEPNNSLDFIKNDNKEDFLTHLKEENIDDDDENYDVSIDAKEDFNFDVDENEVEKISNDEEFGDFKSENKNDTIKNGELKPFKCDQCQFAAKYHSTLTKHVNYVHEGIQKPKCNICGKEFMRKCNLRDHKKNVHERQKYTCDFNDCKSSFDDKNELREHKRNIHADDKMNYNCEHCAKPYNNKRSLNRHIKTAHEQSGLRCEICGKSLSEKWYLQQHIKVIHDRVLEFLCEEVDCTRAFGSAFGLKQHIETVHKGIKNVICAECGNEFYDKARLAQHTKIVHERRTGKKWFICDYEQCDKSFDKMGQLRKHKKNDHVSDKAKYPCDQCNKKYNNEEALLKHNNKIHKGIRVMCSICGKQFKSPYNLPYHMKTHEKDADKDDDTPNTIQFHPDSEFEDVSNEPKRLSKSWHYYLLNKKTNEAKCRFCGHLKTAKGMCSTIQFVNIFEHIFIIDNLGV